MLTGCEKILKRSSTSSGRTGKYLNLRLRFSFVVSLSNHERIFSQPLSRDLEEFPWPTVRSPEECPGQGEHRWRPG